MSTRLHAARWGHPYTVTSSDTAAILFDIDGTLVDSTYHHAIAWQRAFDRSQLPLPLWRIHRTIGMGGDKLVAAVAGDDVEKRLGDTLREAWKDEYLKIKAEVFPLPGAAALVRKLAGEGYAVALASSGEPDPVSGCGLTATPRSRPGRPW